MKFGIDLGHCETAGAVPYPRAVSADDETADNKSKYKLMRLSLVESETVIPTQIILTNEQMRRLSGHQRPSYELLCDLGGFGIGKDLPSNIEDGEKFSYFKVPPKDFDKPCGNSDCARKSGVTHGMVMACYTFALVESILASNTDITKGIGRRSIELLIGCPATGDWTDPQAREDYESLIQEATSVQSVRIIPESRAAMFSSIDQEKNKVSAIKGAIVFDFGSSTADCTYMLLGRKIIEFSWTLGAFEIEHQMALTALEATMQKRGPFEVNRLSFVGVEDQLRQIKELYYSGKIPKGKKEYCTFHDAVDPVPFIINQEMMEYITKRRPIQILCDSRTTRMDSWQKLCRAFFEEAKSIVENTSYLVRGEDGKPEEKASAIDTIVLTGGASNMDFIFDICKEIFPNARIVREPQPSYTVSNGLAWIAISDDEFDSCVSAARNAVDKDHSCDVKALHTAISDGIFDSICDITEKLTKEWADEPGDSLTLRDLRTNLTNYISKSSTQESLKRICQDEIDEWKNTLSQKMEAAVNEQVKRLYSPRVVRAMMIPHDVWKELQANAFEYGRIDAAEMLKDLDLTDFLGKIGILIVQAAIWAICMALGLGIPLLAVPLALAASWVAGEVLKDTDLDKGRSRSARQEVAGIVKGKLMDKKNDVMKEFNASLEQQTVDYGSMVDDTLQKAFEIVTLRRFEL